MNIEQAIVVALKSCSTCAFLRVDVMCEKWDAEPPLEILLEGCDEWVLEIPF